MTFTTRQATLTALPAVGCIPLPQGKTCGQCEALWACAVTCAAKPADTFCRWTPAAFRETAVTHAGRMARGETTP